MRVSMFLPTFEPINQLSLNFIWHFRRPQYRSLRWRRVSPKRFLLPTSIHGDKTPNNIIILTAVETSKPT